MKQDKELMSRKREDHKSNNRKTHYIGKLLLLTLAFYVAVFFIMKVIDHMAPILSNCAHNIAGNVWFSALVSIIAAGPSAVISWLAIKQNQDLAELQNRQHVPSLIIKSIELSEEFVRWSTYKESDVYKSYDGKLKKGIDKYIEDNKEQNAGLLHLDMELLLKNDVSVEGIDVRKVTFIINGVSYTLAKNECEDIDHSLLRNLQTCKRIFKDGMEFYRIKWSMINFVPDEEKLWDELCNAMLESVNRSKSYREFLMQVEADISFTNLEAMTASYILKTIFVENRENIVQMVVKATTQEGRILPIFDMKDRRKILK